MIFKYLISEEKTVLKLNITKSKYLKVISVKTFKIIEKINIFFFF